ncbi:MAG: hypothetical protein ABLT11_11370, partial [Candidatus Acidiferrum sp.]
MTRRLLTLFCSSAIFIFAGCGGGGTITPPTLIRVAVAPSAATVVVGQTQAFSATVTGTTNQAVTWSVNGSGNGSISASGVYTAPATVPSPATVTVTATSQADSTRLGTATVTVVATASSVTVVVTPTSANVSNFRTQQFTANVTGNANTAVTWEVNNVVGGNQKLGFISTSGLYVAPSGTPTKSDGQGGTITTTVTVKAVSQADSTGNGTATVTVVPDNTKAQSGAITLGTSGSNAHDFKNTANNTITCCGGTLGSLVTRAGTQYILSNNHI